MKRALLLVWVFISVITSSAGELYADVPFNAIEGYGGVAFNPLAYPGGAEFKEGEPGSELKNIGLGKPRVGTWYVNLGDVNVDWTSIGVSETFLGNRAEVSYAYEVIAPDGENIHKHNVGGKLLVIPENLNGTNYVPAVSIGAVWKDTAVTAPGIDSNGWDGYLVATKLIKELPRPLLVSAGGLITSGRATGVFGYDKDSDTTFFGNADLLITDNVAVGVEYKQGAAFSDFKNADYWDIHVGWLINKNLSLIGAYVNAGDDQSTKKVGLGNGVVVSLQYSF